VIVATNELDLLTIDELTEGRADVVKVMSKGMLNRHVTQHMVALLDDIDAAVRRKREAGRFAACEPAREPA